MVLVPPYWKWLRKNRHRASASLHHTFPTLWVSFDEPSNLDQHHIKVVVFSRGNGEARIMEEDMPLKDFPNDLFITKLILIS